MDTQKIGQFLKELRKQNNMTQEQLGQRIGVTNKTVSRWETGNYMPPIESLKLLSDIYQISINEILAGESISEESFKNVADDNIISALEQMESKHKKFENIMIVIMCVTSISAIIIMKLLPDFTGLNSMEQLKQVIIISLVWNMAIISNTLNLVAIALRKS